MYQHFTANFDFNFYAGTFGYVGTSVFVKKIYSTVKIDWWDHEMQQHWSGAFLFNRTGKNLQHLFSHVDPLLRSCSYTETQKMTRICCRCDSFSFFPGWKDLKICTTRVSTPKAKCRNTSNVSSFFSTWAGYGVGCLYTLMGDFLLIEIQLFPFSILRIVRF